MVSGGTCRLCYSAQKQDAPPSVYLQDPKQRRRPRRRRDHASQNQQQLPIQQPVLVLIQYENDSNGIILCKWQTTSLSLDPLLKANDAVEETSDCGRHFLEFDETVTVVPNTRENIDGLLRSSLQEDKGIESLYRPWILGDTNHLSADQSQRLCLAIQTKESSVRHKGIAIPLVSPSITILPLQSMVISIVGLKGDTNNSNVNERLSILKQAFWKRQLVGKVVTFEDQWTSRIRLTGDENRSDDEKSAKGGVYAVMESCTPLRLATMVSTHVSHEEKDNGELSLPKNFFMVLPSTYITIQPASRQQVAADTKRSSKSATPPTPAASLLRDTLDCILSKGADDGNVPRTFLLSGPPGVGKTFSVSWAANVHKDTVLCSIRGSELLQGSGSAARSLELEFLKVVEAISMRSKRNNNNESAVAGLVFLDECDALVSVESIAAMLADLLDRVSTNEDYRWKRIVVVGATNRIDSIPSFLRRAGRFDRELPMSPPSAETRAKLLSSLLINLQANQNANEEKISEFALPLEEEIREIAELCVGYVAADLSALVRKAWLLCLQEKNDNIGITINHLEQARSIVGASALRDAALAAPPKITWDDIAGDPGGAKTALRQAIEWPRLKAREFAMLGLQPCRGILLHGPPGCAKTTLARAAAGSSGVAFLSLSPAQVYASSYVGEAERVVRQSFHLARATTPCILFFDEIDSIFGDGSSTDGGSLGGGGRGSSAEARVLSTFLNEMDGVDIAETGKDGVLVLGATNRPWTLDPALLRPGRLGDKIIFLPPPDEEARRSIFEKQFHLSSANNDEKNWDLDVSILAELSEGMTGAEIVGACQEAKIQWMREAVLKLEPAKEGGFQQQDCIVNALMSIKPLLSNPEALEEFHVFESRDKKKINL